MKKIISFLLVFAMLFSLVILASCGEKEESTPTKKTKPTDPVELVKETFSKDNIVLTLSEVKEPVQDAKDKFDALKAAKITNSVSVNKLNVGGNAILPSPLVLSGEIRSDKKALVLDGKISFVGDEIGAKLYAATKSGKTLDDETLEPGDLTVIVDLGDLYEGNLGLDEMIKSLVEQSKKSVDDSAAAKAEELIGELRGALEKYFSEDQIGKISKDISAAVEKALGAIPENGFEKGKGTLKYGDVYTAEDANVSTLTIDETAASKIAVAFLTYLRDNSASEALKKIKESVDLNELIETVTADPENLSDVKLIVTIASNEEATLFDFAAKDGDKDQKLFTLFSKDGKAFYVDLYDPENNNKVAGFKAEKTDKICELVLSAASREGKGKAEILARVEKKSDETYAVEFKASGEKDEGAAVVSSITGNVTKTGEASNGSLSGDLNFKIEKSGADSEPYAITAPVSFKIERAPGKCDAEVKLGLNVPDKFETEIEIKAGAEKLEGTEITLPDASSVKQLGEDNMLEVYQTAMANLYQKCPNIIQFLAGLSGGGEASGEWD